jgi:hypothetical protein
MKIKITEKDIKNGNPCDSEACAVSLALSRHFKTNAVSIHTIMSICIGINFQKRT